MISPEKEALRVERIKSYWADVKAGRRFRVSRYKPRTRKTVLNGNGHVPPPPEPVFPEPVFAREPAAFVPRPSEDRVRNYLRALWLLAAEEGVDPKRIVPLLLHEQPA